MLHRARASAFMTGQVLRIGGVLWYGMKHLCSSRGGADDALADAIVAEAQRATVTAGDRHRRRQAADDPSARPKPGTAPDATTELRGTTSHPGAVAVSMIARRRACRPVCRARGQRQRRDRVIHTVRYQYVMRRIGTTHDQYRPLRQPACPIRRHRRASGYAVHRRAPASAARPQQLAWRVDSVSELPASVETFSTTRHVKPADGAGEDEERFVDRRNSVMFTSAVLWRS
jgi:hypothetical protein